jgi:hypothetical protein
MFHTWRVKTLLIVPKYQSNQPAVGETLQYASRLPQQARNYGGDSVERFSPVFGTWVDLLAFDMAVVPGVGQVDMIDISNLTGGTTPKIGLHQPL